MLLCLSHHSEGSVQRAQDIGDYRGIDRYDDVLPRAELFHWQEGRVAFHTSCVVIGFDFQTQKFI